MAKKRKILTEVEEIEKLLQKHGFHEVTEEEKKQPWYKQHLKHIERWKKEECEPATKVREPQPKYRPKSTKTSKSKA